MLADPSDSATPHRPVISDQAKLFSKAQITQLQQVIKRAREEGNIAATVVAETTMLRLSPFQRANELNDEYRDQWGQLFPDQPLAEEIDLASSDGPVRSNEMLPLPLTFYFARATGEGSQLIAIGGMDVLKSEIGTPETNTITYEAGSRFNKMNTSGEDPARAFLEMIEIFLNDATAQRAEMYRENKSGNNSDLTAIILIGIGCIFTAAIVLVLRKLSGKGRENIVETTLPKLPLKTRLGGRHSGGMTANISWDPSDKNPTAR